MTGKVFAVIVGVVALIILTMSLPMLPDAVESFRTDVRTQSYSVATGVGITTTSVALTNALWNADVSYVTNLGSNITESLIADNYTLASKALNLSGLSANITRTITVSYRTAGLGDNPAADTGITFLPGVVVGLVILVPLILLASLLMGK